MKAEKIFTDVGMLFYKEFVEGFNEHIKFVLDDASVRVLVFEANRPVTNCLIGTREAVSDKLTTYKFS
jgi:hypothetical protein